MNQGTKNVLPFGLGVFLTGCAYHFVLGAQYTHPIEHYLVVAWNNLLWSVLVMLPAFIGFAGSAHRRCLRPIFAAIAGFAFFLATVAFWALFQDIVQPGTWYFVGILVAVALFAWGVQAGFGRPANLALNPFADAHSDRRDDTRRPLS